MRTKVCTICKNEKNTEEFYFKNKKNGYKLRAQCKKCVIKLQLEYQKKNIEKVKQKQKEYYYNNKNRIKSYDKDYKKKTRRENPERSMLSEARKRAKKKNLDFNIDLDDIFIPKYCPYLNLELKICNDKLADCSPTLDRIDPSKGYIKNNVEVISWRANTIKSFGTLEEHKKITDRMEKILILVDEQNK